jgi:spore coat protein U-like protein
MMKHLARTTLLAALAATASAAYAGSAQQNVAVTTSVVGNCRFSGSPVVAFGSYDPVTAADVDSTGTLTIECTKGTSYSITLGAGANASGAVRRMALTPDDTVNYVSYELYTDNARSTVWNMTNTVGAVSASKSAQSVTIYGRIANGPTQDPTVGSYSDTVVATINF